MQMCHIGDPGHDISREPLRAHLAVGMVSAKQPRHMGFRQPLWGRFSVLDPTPTIPPLPPEIVSHNHVHLQ